MRQVYGHLTCRVQAAAESATYGAPRPLASPPPWQRIRYIPGGWDGTPLAPLRSMRSGPFGATAVFLALLCWGVGLPRAEAKGSIGEGLRRALARAKTFVRGIARGTAHAPVPLAPRTGTIVSTIPVAGDNDVARPAGLCQMRALLSGSRELFHPFWSTSHFVGTLREPVVLFRYSVSGELPREIRSTCPSFDQVRLKDVERHFYGSLERQADRRVPAYLGYSLFYASDENAARVTSAGNGMPDYRYLMQVKVAAGTRVMLVNGDGENEVVVRDPSSLSLVGSPKPLK